ncbi:MAG: phosphate ABC transporter substrate-binding protein PstS [Sideroxyarcus sp.]|nr:phosphate ABC transporter substrate-binding protein PstS [Sideroxyarcus sp.]
MSKLNRLLGSLFLSATLLSAGAARAADITGAGATFPYPAYVKWGESYKSQTGMGLNYQPIGSGNGIKQIQSNTVDFGATDIPLSQSELGIAGLVQFPVMIGGVVPVVNIAGIAPGQLKLDGKVLADIYLGKITRWNDARIAADNAGLALPNEAIRVLYRSDVSGTSYIFTKYLSQVNTEWMRNFGTGSALNWPVGTGGKGNEGVTSYVQRINYSIGYVEYAYALQNSLAYIRLKNRDGQFVKPEAASFQSAVANATWNLEYGFPETATNEPGKDSWPITGVTFALMHKTPSKPGNAIEALKFFDWVLTHGSGIASEMQYVTLPPNIQTMVRDVWKTQIKSAAGVPLWK